MKSIMFKTKIFHEGKMYLLVSDVTKLMEISEKAFCKKYSDKIVEIHRRAAPVDHVANRAWRDRRASAGSRPCR